MYKRFKQILQGKSKKRGPDEQRRVDRQTTKLALYHFPACPYCHVVGREIKRLSLNIHMRDIHKSRAWHKELWKGGGKDQVPCLRIQEKDTVRWLYESSDIVRYLKKRFGH